MTDPWPLTQPTLPGQPNWEQLQIILLALLVFVAFTNWLIAWRLAHQTRLYQGLARSRVRLPGAIDYLLQDKNPHTVLCWTLARVTGQKIDDLTPLAGSVDPPYLLLREDKTRRRLLLAGAGNLNRASRSAGLRGRIPRKHRWAIKPAAQGPPALEAIAEAWAALAPGLGLPQETPFTKSWELAVLPPEELE